MVNLQEVLKVGWQLAQFVLGLAMATVSAIQQLDLADPNAATPDTNVPQSAPAVGMRLAEAELAIFEQINAERLAAGLEPLVLDPVLTEIARLRATDMLARGYLSHYDPVAGERADWALEARYALPPGGEVIYWTTGSIEQAAVRAVPWWMGIEGHRAGVMGAYGRGGIGLARSGGKTIVVALLAPWGQSQASYQHKEREPDWRMGPWTTGRDAESMTARCLRLETITTASLNMWTRTWGRRS